jgi:hypothetical protein
MTQMPGHRAAATALACIATATPSVSGRTEGRGSPIYGVTIAAGYRQREIIAPSHEAGLDGLRVILGNLMAIGTFRDAVLPFSDGTILVKLVRKHVPLAGIDGAYLPGRATTVQVMVKASKRHLDTGSWGFGGSSTANQWARRSIGHASLAMKSMATDTTTFSPDLRSDANRGGAQSLLRSRSTCSAAHPRLSGSGLQTETTDLDPPTGDADD